MTTDDTWRDRAACTGSHGLFTLPRTKDYTRLRHFVARAKAICAHCPVRADCLDEGNANGDQYSIYGGLTPAERRAAQAAIPINHGTPGGYKTHYKRGERPCDDCQTAFRAYAQKRRETA